MIYCHWLVVSSHPSEKDLTSSVGMMRFPIFSWENAKFMATIHHQPGKAYVDHRSIYQDPRFTSLVTLSVTHCSVYLSPQFRRTVGSVSIEIRSEIHQDFVQLKSWSSSQ